MSKHHLDTDHDDYFHPGCDIDYPHYHCHGCGTDMGLPGVDGNGMCTFCDAPVG